MYARYKFVQRLGEDVGSVRSRLNHAALGLGLVSCLGMCIVGTFQVGAFISYSFYLYVQPLPPGVSKSAALP